MDVYRDSVPSSSALVPTAVTIGAYDGVHRGHRAVLQLVRDLADARGLQSVVVTFDRHPAELVRPESAPKLLTTLDQKLELLESTGLVDACLLLTFDEHRASQTAPEFVHDVLVGSLRCRLVVVGADFHFGYRRGGNVALLDAMGTDLGFEVLGLSLVAAAPGEAAFSSTRVRQCLAAGDVESATAILGREHEVRGVVERGDQRGRELGFPTANIALPERTCLPVDGVYAGTILIDGGEPRPAAISIGRRPTFYEEAGLLLLEVYVLDFSGDLYGKPVRVRFQARVRGQERFGSVEALIAQMTDDVDRCRTLLGA